jgi:hypothetical protein
MKRSSNQKCAIAMLTSSTSESVCSSQECLRSEGITGQPCGRNQRDYSGHGHGHDHDHGHDYGLLRLSRGCRESSRLANSRYPRNQNWNRLTDRPRTVHPAAGDDMCVPRIGLVLGIIAFGLAACDNRGGPGGTTGGAAGSSSSAGGATSAGGTTGTAGTTSAGGGVAGTGGSNSASGGATSTGDTTGTGGSTSTGGVTSATGGTTATGNMTSASGGASGGTAGASSSDRRCNGWHGRRDQRRTGGRGCRHRGRRRGWLA